MVFLTRGSSPKVTLSALTGQPAGGLRINHAKRDTIRQHKNLHSII